jgi:hypothetical protein
MYINSKSKEIAIDLDGTILENAYPNLGKPIEDNVEVMRALKEDGWKISIFTARLADKGAKEKIEKYLKENDIPFDKISNEKSPRTSVFIDDRAIGVEKDKPWGDDILDRIDKVIKQHIEASKWASQGFYKAGWLDTNNTVHNTEDGLHIDYIRKNPKLVNLPAGQMKDTEVMEWTLDKGWIRFVYTGEELVVQYVSSNTSAKNQIAEIKEIYSIPESMPVIATVNWKDKHFNSYKEFIEASKRSEFLGQGYWVDPNGIMYEVESTHGEWMADNIDKIEPYIDEYDFQEFVKEFKVGNNDNYADAMNNVFYDLIDSGWIRIAITEKEIVIEGDNLKNFKVLDGILDHIAFDYIVIRHGDEDATITYKDWKRAGFSLEKTLRKRVKADRRYKGVGIYWAWDREYAECHWGKPTEKGYENILLIGKVHPESVNAEKTLLMNMSFSYNEEKEIRLYPNAQVNIIGYEYKGKEEMFETGIMVKARSMVLWDKFLDLYNNDGFYQKWLKQWGDDYGMAEAMEVGLLDYEAGFEAENGRPITDKDKKEWISDYQHAQYNRAWDEYAPYLEDENLMVYRCMTIRNPLKFIENLKSGKMKYSIQQEVTARSHGSWWVSPEGKEYVSPLVHIEWIYSNRAIADKYLPKEDIEALDWGMDVDTEKVMKDFILAGWTQIRIWQKFNTVINLSGKCNWSAVEGLLKANINDSPGEQVEIMNMETGKVTKAEYGMVASFGLEDAVYHPDRLMNYQLEGANGFQDRQKKVDKWTAQMEKKIYNRELKFDWDSLNEYVVLTVLIQENPKDKNVVNLDGERANLHEKMVSYFKDNNDLGIIPMTVNSEHTTLYELVRNIYSKEIDKELRKINLEGEKKGKQEFWDILFPVDIIYEYVQSIHGKPEDFETGTISERLAKYDEYKLVPDFKIANLDLNEWRVTKDYVNEIKEGLTPDNVDPIVVTPEFSILDGIHRSNALHDNGFDTIPAYVAVEKVEAGEGRIQLSKGISVDEKLFTQYMNIIKQMADKTLTKDEIKELDFLRQDIHELLRQDCGKNYRDLDGKTTGLKWESKGDMPYLNKWYDEVVKYLQQMLGDDYDRAEEYFNIAEIEDLLKGSAGMGHYFVDPDGKLITLKGTHYEWIVEHAKDLSIKYETPVKQIKQSEDTQHSIYHRMLEDHYTGISVYGSEIGLIFNPFKLSKAGLLDALLEIGHKGDRITMYNKYKSGVYGARKLSLKNMLNAEYFQIRNIAYNYYPESRRKDGQCLPINSTVAWALFELGFRRYDDLSLVNDAIDLEYEIYDKVSKQTRNDFWHCWIKVGNEDFDFADDVFKDEEGHIVNVNDYRGTDELDGERWVNKKMKDEIVSYLRSKYADKLPKQLVEAKEKSVEEWYRFWKDIAEKEKSGDPIGRNDCVEYVPTSWVSQFHEYDRLGEDTNKSKESLEGMKKAISEEKKYGCLMVELPKDIADHIRTFAKTAIKDEDLYTEEEGFGREDEIHTTVLYGLEEQTGDKVLEQVTPVNVKLGKIARFSDDKKPYDVMIIEVESEDLHNLHEHVGDEFEHITTYSDYKPHITLAYVKKGACKDLDGKSGSIVLPEKGMGVEPDTKIRLGDFYYTNAEKKRFDKTIDIESASMTSPTYDGSEDSNTKEEDYFHKGVDNVKNLIFDDDLVDALTDIATVGIGDRNSLEKKPLKRQYEGEENSILKDKKQKSKSNSIVDTIEDIDVDNWIKTW